MYFSVSQRRKIKQIKVHLLAKSGTPPFPNFYNQKTKSNVKAVNLPLYKSSQLYKKTKEEKLYIFKTSCKIVFSHISQIRSPLLASGEDSYLDVKKGSYRNIAINALLRT